MKFSLPIVARMLAWVLVPILLALPLAGQEEVNLDALPDTPEPSRAAGPAAGGLVFNIYADADLELDAPLDFSTLAINFLQNHSALMVKANYQDLVSAEVDVLHPDQYFDLGVNLGGLAELAGVAGAAESAGSADTGGSPGNTAGDRGRAVAGSSGSPSQGGKNMVWLHAGRILLPFGDFEFHHLYGGRQDENGVFLPKLWSDYGLDLNARLGDDWMLDVYAVNGSGMLGNSPSSTPALDENPLKALGTRLRWTPLPAVWASLSAYWDPYGSTTFDLSHELAYFGLDGGFKTGPLEWKLGGIGGIIAPNGPVYGRYAWYVQMIVPLGEGFTLRFRGGQMDPDTRVVNAVDQFNINTALIWRTGPLETSIQYYLNESTSQPFASGVDTNNHQLLVKLLLTI